MFLSGLFAAALPPWCRACCSYLRWLAYWVLLAFALNAGAGASGRGRALLRFVDVSRRAGGGLLARAPHATAGGTAARQYKPRVRLTKGALAAAVLFNRRAAASRQ